MRREFTKGQETQESEKATKPRAVHPERHDMGPVTAVNQVRCKRQDV